MAISLDNIITKGLSGKIGNLIVFASRNGKTIVRKYPHSFTPNQNQVNHHIKFAQAATAAKNFIKDPDKKKLLTEIAKKKQKNLSAYNIALANFLVPADITDLNLKNYTGAAGQSFSFAVKSFVPIKAVSVQIKVNSSVIDSAEAVITNGVYSFTASNPNPNPAQSIAVFTITDLADIKTVRELPLK